MLFKWRRLTSSPLHIFIYFIQNSSITSKLWHKSWNSQFAHPLYILYSKEVENGFTQCLLFNYFPLFVVSYILSYNFFQKNKYLCNIINIIFAADMDYYKIAKKYATEHKWDIVQPSAERNGYRYYHLDYTGRARYTGHPHIIKISPVGKVQRVLNFDDIY